MLTSYNIIPKLIIFKFKRIKKNEKKSEDKILQKGTK